MSQALSTVAREKRLFKALRAQPALLERMESLVALTQVESVAALSTADAIEEKVIQEVRHLGREVISGWAQAAEVQVAAEVSGTQPGVRLREKKGSAGRPPSGR